MDPEYLRIVVTGLVGVVPAVLLYLQNKGSREHEATQRALDRGAESARRQQDVDREKASSADAQVTASRDAERQRVVRFLTAVEQVVTFMHVHARRTTRTNPSAEVLKEVTDAAEQLSLDLDGIGERLMRAVQDRLNQLVTMPLGPNDIETRSESIRADLGVLRSHMREQWETHS